MRTCCDEWQEAQQPGTDNERYGRLVSEHKTSQGVWYQLGGIDVRVKFCPWCGADKLTPDALEVAAKNVVAKCFEERGEWDDLKQAIVELANTLERK